MWTAKIAHKVIEKGQLCVDIQYTDGTELITERVCTTSPSDEWLAAVADHRLKQLSNANDSMKQYFETLVVGEEIDLSKLPPPEEPPIE